MHDEVCGERQSCRADQPRHVQLALVPAAVAAYPIGQRSLRVLEAELDVVEPGLGQRGQTTPVQHYPGGDEVRVESTSRGLSDEREQVPPGSGLPTGEMHLQYAKRRRLVQYAQPGRGVQL